MATADTEDQYDKFANHLTVYYNKPTCQIIEYLFEYNNKLFLISINLPFSIVVGSIVTLWSYNRLKVPFTVFPRMALLQFSNYIKLIKNRFVLFHIRFTLMSRKINVLCTVFYNRNSIT